MKDVGTIINDVYAGDSSEYFNDVSTKCYDMLRNMRRTKYFTDVKFIINEYADFIRFLMKHCEYVESANDKLSYNVRYLTDKLACRENELKLVKNERNTLSQHSEKVF